MVIYGVALLSFCMLVGVFAGDILGQLIGVEAMSAASVSPCCC
jgi:malonate transporter MadL subunit